MSSICASQYHPGDWIDVMASAASRLLRSSSIGDTSRKAACDQFVIDQSGHYTLRERRQAMAHIKAHGFRCPPLAEAAVIALHDLHEKGLGMHGLKVMGMSRRQALSSQSALAFLKDYETGLLTTRIEGHVLDEAAIVGLTDIYRGICRAHALNPNDLPEGIIIAVDIEPGGAGWGEW